MRRLYVLLILFCSILDLYAVTLTPYVHKETSGMNDAEITLMMARLKSALTSAKITPGSTNCRFVVSAQVHLVDKELTATTPAMTAVRLEITVGVGDRIDGKCYSSTVLTVKGVGDTEQKARMNAIKSIKPSSPALKETVEQGAEKVLAYYDENAERIFRDADNVIKNKPNDEASYQQALNMLVDCPLDCKYYDQFSEKISTVYAAWVDHESLALYTTCRARWSADQSYESAVEVMNDLANVESQACYSDALKLMDEVKQKMAADEAFAKKMQELELQHKHEMDKEAMQLRREKQQHDKEMRQMTMNAVSSFVNKWNGSSFLSIF